MKYKINFKIVIGALLCFIVGCGLHSDLAKNTKADHLYKQPITVVQGPRKDTIPKNIPRTWSAEQMARFIALQYQSNYDKLFAPDFKRLNGIVDKQSTIIQDQANSIQHQANSIKTQNGYLIEYRRRMDSIARDRNKERTQKIMAQDSQVYWQKQAINSQRELITFIKRQSKENKTQVDTNTVLSICCLFGLVIIAGLFLYLKYQIRSISKRVDGLLENQHNV